MKRTTSLLMRATQVLMLALIFLLLNRVEPPSSKARESGIASRYVGDRGIENDPDVVFVEDFEQATLDAILSVWEYSTHAERMSISSDTPSLSKGRQSLFVRGSADMYQRLLPGYDQLYIRFYAKFETSCDSAGHWVRLGGRNPSIPWPWPEAGKCPEKGMNTGPLAWNLREAVGAGTFTPTGCICDPLPAALAGAIRSAGVLLPGLR